jgi:hypothetical protein
MARNTSAVATWTLAALASIMNYACEARAVYTYLTIDAPGANLTIVNGVNNSGQAVGIYGPGSSANQGFVEQGGVFANLNASVAQGINNLGEIVGINSNGAFLERNGSYTMLNGIDHPQGINNLDVIVGQ